MNIIFLNISLSKNTAKVLKKLENAEKMRNIFENIRIISKSFVFLQQNCYLHISIFFNIMGKFIEEFKAFAVKGNAVDMAVGVIIGGAFGKIVSSIVDDIIMPPIGYLIGGVNFSDLKVVLPAIIEGQESATINYGNFIQTLIDFLIIAFCVFMLVKGINKLKKKEDEKPAAPAPAPEPSAEEKLLTEIRDLLKNK